jgi:hypothetical protein
MEDRGAQRDGRVGFLQIFGSYHVWKYLTCSGVKAADTSNIVVIAVAAAAAAATAGASARVTARGEDVDRTFHVRRKFQLTWSGGHVRVRTYPIQIGIPLHISTPL